MIFIILFRVFIFVFLISALISNRYGIWPAKTCCNSTEWFSLGYLALVVTVNTHTILDFI